MAVDVPTLPEPEPETSAEAGEADNVVPMTRRERRLANNRRRVAEKEKEDARQADLFGGLDPEPEDKAPEAVQPVKEAEQTPPDCLKIPSRSKPPQRRQSKNRPQRMRRVIPKLTPRLPQNRKTSPPIRPMNPPFWAQTCPMRTSPSRSMPRGTRWHRPLFRAPRDVPWSANTLKSWSKSCRV